MKIKPDLYNYLSRGVGTGKISMNRLRELHAVPEEPQIREQISQGIKNQALSYRCPNTHLAGSNKCEECIGVDKGLKLAESVVNGEKV